MQELEKNIPIGQIIQIFTFLTAIAATTFVERLKDRYKAKAVLKNLKTEISDEISDLPRRFKRMNDSLCMLRNIQTGVTHLTGDTKYVPRDSSCYFIKDAIERSFLLLTKQQRYAIKSLNIQSNAMNDYIKNIDSTETAPDNIEKQINNYKKYLYTGACMFNTMRIVIGDSKANTSCSDKDIIDSVFKELNIELRIEDLVTRKSITTTD